MQRTLPFIAAASVLLVSTLPAVGRATAISSVDNDELRMSYSLLASEFYKKVDPQIALDGARAGMLAFIERGGIKSPVLPALHAGPDPAANAKLLNDEVAGAVATYGKKFTPTDLTYAALSGLLGSVHDKYTVFLSPKEYAALNEGLDGGNFSGVGISIGVDEKTRLLVINQVIPDGPAEKAGLKSGDTVLTIDGTSTKGLTTEQDAKLLRGAKGTQVKLIVDRDGTTQPAIAVTRDIIHQPSVYAKMLPDNIGYARLTVFGANTAGELTKALDKLQADGAKAYVLDLRDNGGGYLNAAIDVSSKFIASGPIVSVEARGGQDTQYDAENVAITPRPLAVLVNKYTASASEITSGALQDDGVGALIGEKTYGKGVVQTIHPLPDGSAVKITTARYLTPRGRDINLVGIQPDIAIVEPKTSKLGDPASDPQLQSAITYLQGKIAAQAGTPTGT